MDSKSFIFRVIVPALPVAGLAVISYFGYFGSRNLEPGMLKQGTAAFFGFTYFLSISFGTIWVYVRTRLNGASVKEGILASFITPFAWMTKEVLVLTESHPFIECLYWYLNPLNLWLVFLMIAEFGIAALIVRSLRLRRGEPVPSMRWPVILIAGSLTCFVLGYAWGKGENFFVIFLEGYRMLFGSGL